MTYGSHSAADTTGTDSPRRTVICLVPSSRSRTHRGVVHSRSLLPVIGAEDIILPSFDETLGAFAIRAQEGDTEARDALYFAFLPKLQRMARSIRPPFAPPGAEGIWTRDDVDQEAYLIFLELMDAWSGDVSFTAFVLSRFPWRLKDVIRRGIGRSSVPRRWATVPIEEAEEVPGDLTVAPDARSMLNAVLAGLPKPLDAVLVDCVVDGMTKTEIAKAFGVSRRTMVRYWQDIRAHATNVLEDDVPG